MSRYTKSFIVPYELKNFKNALVPSAKFATVYVMSKIEGKWFILVHKRSGVMTHAFKYSSQGGHREEGETSLECAKRELREETGLEVKGNGYLFSRDDNPKFANYVFFMKSDDIVEGTKGPQSKFEIEIDMDNDFSDIRRSLIITGTGHCLMNIEANINNRALYWNFKNNLYYLMDLLR